MLKQLTSVRIDWRQEVEQKSIISLENMVCYEIYKMDKLKRHIQNMEYLLDAFYSITADITEAMTFAERIKRSQRNLNRCKTKIRLLYNKLLFQILDKIAIGDAIEPIEKFFIYIRPHIEDIINGNISIWTLDAQFNWKIEQNLNPKI